MSRLEIKNYLEEYGDGGEYERHLVRGGETVESSEVVPV